VDDIIDGTTNIVSCQEFFNLMSKEFDMSMLRKLRFFLGLQIKQHEEGISINQGKYVKEPLKR